MPRKYKPNKAMKKFLTALKKFGLEQPEYAKQLYSQGKDNIHICPRCFEAGKRNSDCTNTVIVTDMVTISGKLVCCKDGKNLSGV